MFGFLHARRYSLGRSLIAALTLSWLALVFQACALGASVELRGQPDGLKHVPGCTTLDQANAYFDGGANLLTMGASVCQPEVCQTLGVVADIATKKDISTGRIDYPEAIPAALARPATGRWLSRASNFRLSQPDYLPPQPTLTSRVLLI